MNLYIFEHPGIYLGGYTVAVTETEEEAIKEAKKVIDNEPGLSVSLHHNELKLVKTIPLADEPIAALVWNGDY